MQSRLLANLLEQARLAPDRVVWARAVCRAAAHYARHGEHEHAANAIGLVRGDFESDHNPEVGVWLMLAEGIAHFFEVRPSEAYDRTQRAYAIARTLSLRAAIPTCTAWMAHFHFNDGNYDAMTKYLREALTLIESTDHQAASRTTLVLADAYHFSGSFDKARPWYERCRLHATAEEDDATLSALFHNVAAFRAANVRLASAFGQIDERESRRAWAEAESARTFDILLQGRGLPSLFPLLQGQLLSAEGEYERALLALSSVDKLNLHERLKPSLLAERAWCRANIGELERAWVDLKLALSLASENIDVDDRAYIYARASQIAFRNRQSSESEDWKTHSFNLLNAHRTMQAKLLKELDTLTATTHQL